MATKLSLKTKLLLAFGFVSIFILMIAGIGLHSMKKVQTEYSYVSDVLVRNIQKVSWINDNTHLAIRANFRIITLLMKDDNEGVEKIMSEFKTITVTIQVPRTIV